MPDISRQGRNRNGRGQQFDLLMQPNWKHIRDEDLDVEAGEVEFPDDDCDMGYKPER